jgi:hypothetical protein
MSALSNAAFNAASIVGGASAIATRFSVGA